MCVWVCVCGGCGCVGVDREREVGGGEKIQKLNSRYSHKPRRIIRFSQFCRDPSISVSQSFYNYTCIHFHLFVCENSFILFILYVFFSVYFFVLIFRKFVHFFDCLHFCSSSLKALLKKNFLPLSFHFSSLSISIFLSVSATVLIH